MASFIASVAFIAMSVGMLVVVICTIVKKICVKNKFVGCRTAQKRGEYKSIETKSDLGILVAFGNTITSFFSFPMRKPELFQRKPEQIRSFFSFLMRKPELLRSFFSFLMRKLELLRSFFSFLMRKPELLRSFFSFLMIKPELLRSFFSFLMRKPG